MEQLYEQLGWRRSGFYGKDDDMAVCCLLRGFKNQYSVGKASSIFLYILGCLKNDVDYLSKYYHFSTSNSISPCIFSFCHLMIWKTLLSFVGNIFIFFKGLSNVILTRYCNGMYYFCFPPRGFGMHGNVWPDEPRNVDATKCNCFANSAVCILCAVEVSCE